MKLVLATSPHVKHVAVLQSDFQPRPDLMYTFAPVGLLSLLAVVRDSDLPIDAGLFDTNRTIIGGAAFLDERFYGSIASAILERDPDVVGFMTECDSYHHVLQVCAQLKVRAPHVSVVLGGPHASAVAAATMARAPFIDAVVIGEGERSFPRLLSALLNDIPEPVAGTLRRVDGAVIDGGPGQLVASLDELPIPAYDLYVADTGEEAFVEVGRGCPFQCTFCSTAPYWNRRHRVKTPGRILAEIELVQRLYASERVHFTHDLFTTDRRWVRSVCEALLDAGTPVRWTCSARTDTVDRDLLDLMSRAGCDAIYFGIESGSQRVLRAIHKDIPLEDSLATLGICRDVGITPNAGFIAGLPMEDEASLDATFEAYEKALRLGTRPTHIFGYCPFADSSLYPELHDLECTGHFVDIPLGSATDNANRDLIRSDPELYGAYFRPRLGALAMRRRAAMAGIDEFSPLVEATLYPSLALAAALGGMGALYLRWVDFIARSNVERRAPAFRVAYGSPAHFASFLALELAAADGAADAALAAADALAVHLGVLQEFPVSTATTMASHRSLPNVPVEAVSQVSLSTPLRRGSVLATLRSSFDVVPVLAGSTEVPLRSPTNLVWQGQPGGAGVRVLTIDDDLADLLADVADREISVGELILSRSQRGVSSRPIDAHAALSAAAVAARAGLIEA